MTQTITTTITDVKARLSHYVSLAEIKKEYIIIERHDKPAAMLVPVGEYRKTNKSKKINWKKFKNSRSGFEKFAGIIKEDKIPSDWREERTEYLLNKHK